LGIAGCKIYALKKVIQLFCMTWGASAINFIGLNMEKSIQGSVCLTVFLTYSLGKKRFFFKNNDIVQKKCKCFLETTFFLKKNVKLYGLEV
jgi:hypothetical protein